jgi:hypothetical protein
LQNKIESSELSILLEDLMAMNINTGQALTELWNNYKDDEYQ